MKTLLLLLLTSTCFAGTYKQPYPSIFYSTVTLPLFNAAGVCTNDANGLLATTPILSVPFGGSGAATFTSNGLMYGNGTSALGVTAAGTNGQFYVAKTSNPPQVVTMSGDATVSNSGAISLKNTGTAGTYTKVTTDAQGRVSSGTTLSTGDIPTLNQNTTGTAANVTGTVAIANGGTGQTTVTNAFNALQPMTLGGDLIYGGASGAAAVLHNGSANQVLISNGTTAAPSWADASATTPTGSYWSGFFVQNSTSDPLWSVANSSFTDPVLSGTNTLTTRVSSGFTVGRANSGKAGVQFLPASATAVYFVSSNIVVSTVAGSGVEVQARLWDGTNVIATATSMSPNGTTAAPNSINLSGVYVPGTASQVTLTFQLAQTSATNIQIGNNYDTKAQAIEMSILRIK